MEIGCVFAPTLDTPEHIRVAEDLGYSRALVYDSPAFLADAWMMLARAAERTSRIRIGVCAITPRLRHLVANAGAVATLNALAPGRVDVVVGSGFTSQLMLGKKPAAWAEVEEYVVGLRALLAGDELEWDGSVIGLRHGRLCGVTLPAPVEIRVAAHGPKGYAVAARSADGIVTNPTHHSANTGPDSDSRSLVLYYGTVLDPGEDYTSERIIDATGPYAAFQLHIGGQGMASNSAEAAAYQRHIAALDAPLRHLEVHRGHLIEVTDAERPLMTPTLLRQATASGTGEEVRARIESIKDSGVQGILYGPMGADIPRELVAFARAAGLSPTHNSPPPKR
jgi:5,10-methylenetetrahydromethanopterin reductase